MTENVSLGVVKGQQEGASEMAEEAYYQSDSESETSDSEYEIEEIEVDESELKKESYLTFLNKVRKDFREFGADEMLSIELRLLVEEILEKWYDESLEKMYEKYKCEDGVMIEELLDKIMSVLSTD